MHVNIPDYLIQGFTALQTHDERVKVMCYGTDCFLSDPLEDMTDEKLSRILNEDYRRFQKGVVKSVSIADNVTVHFLPGMSHYRETVINTITKLQENYPATKGKVEFFFPVRWTTDEPQTQAATARFENGETSINGPDRVVAINDYGFGEDMSSPGFHVPVYENIAEGPYTIVHEWGHVLDDRFRSLDNMYLVAKKIDEQGITPEFVSSLSAYGASDEAESYAEAFAEWALSNNSTDVFFARWYAKEYGWPTVSEPIHWTKRRNKRPEYYNGFGTYYQSPYAYESYEDNSYSNDEYGSFYYG